MKLATLPLLWNWVRRSRGRTQCLDCCAGWVSTRRRGRRGRTLVLGNLASNPGVERTNVCELTQHWRTKERKWNNWRLTWYRVESAFICFGSMIPRTVKRSQQRSTTTTVPATITAQLFRPRNVPASIRPSTSLSLPVTVTLPVPEEDTARLEIIYQTLVNCFSDYSLSLHRTSNLLNHLASSPNHGQSHPRTKSQVDKVTQTYIYRRYWIYRLSRRLLKLNMRSSKLWIFIPIIQFSL